MKLRLIVLCFIGLIIASSGWSLLPNLHLMNSYFYDANETFINLEYQNIGLNHAVLHSTIFSLSYGVSEAMQLGFSVPYLIIGGANDTGILGDMTASIKFSLAEALMLNWKIVGEFFFRFATGLGANEATRTVNGYTVSYFPFSTHTTMFAPSILGRVSIGPVFVNLAVRYCSENELDAGIFDLNWEYDRIDMQLSFDVYFKIPLDPEQGINLILRPALYLDYKKNFTSLTIIDDSFLITLETNFKIKKILHWKFYLSMPVYTEKWFYTYQTGIQIGKSF